MADNYGRKPPRQNRASLHNVYFPSSPRAHVPETAGEEVGQQRGSKGAQGVAPTVFRAVPAKEDHPGRHPFPAVNRLVDVPAFLGVPVHPLALGLGVNESSLLRTLVLARRLVKRGWAQQVAWCDQDGRTLPQEMGPATHFSLVGAVRSAGNGELVGEYALKVIRQVLGEYDLHRWNDNPVRTKQQVLDLLDECLERAGGKRQRRGGWALGGVH